MPYVPRSHEMLPPRKLHGVMTKVHILNYPPKSAHLEKDLKQACECVDEIVVWPGCEHGFFILHRTDDLVYVTSGRWIDGDTLHIDFASKTLLVDLESLEEVDDEFSEQYDYECNLPIWELKIIDFERAAYVNNMIQPDIPNPDGYLGCKMTGNTV